MSTDNQKLVNCQTGDGQALWVSSPVNFILVLLAQRTQFSGQIVIKKGYISYDKSNQEHDIIQLGIINLFEQFGNGYICFKMNDSTVFAMLSKKSLILKGHQRPKLQFAININQWTKLQVKIKVIDIAFKSLLHTIKTHGPQQLNHFLQRR